ncbi:RDD family protein [Prevotella copri]|uniref:RDD family protein n=1 Tax=Segatella copri TaxID=165179 RepID=UPI001C3917FF|nr:RDD family protein [Segatella copri]MBV3428500.1 RDD family protein [Segatella copri]
MTSSNITTNQFVRIDQTPASIAERVIARIIDMVIAGIIGTATMYIYFFELDYETKNQLNYLFFFLIILPLWLYDFLWETFNEGQSPGKYIMKIRVVNKDGSRPTMGSFFMRWLLSTIDVGLSGIGLLFILLTKNAQRLGDLAAGTMVIKQVNLDKIHVSLDEFYYAKKDYRPVYEEAKNLSQAQIEVIEKAVYGGNGEHENQIATLADKVAKFLGIEDKLKASIQKGNSKEKFLATILHDYNYYLLELV